VLAEYLLHVCQSGTETQVLSTQARLHLLSFLKHTVDFSIIDLWIIPHNYFYLSSPDTRTLSGWDLPPWGDGVKYLSAGNSDHHPPPTIN